MLNWRFKMPDVQRDQMSQRLRRLMRPAWLGTLRRTAPLSARWGVDRGTPVDRYYIQNYLAQYRPDIHGCTLEMQNRNYTDRYGLGVERSEVLDIDPNNRTATIIADLTTANVIPSNSFDCFILTQTLQFIFDLRAALAEAYRVLRPHGVLLLTVPALSKLDRHYVDYWRFTPDACMALVAEAFGKENVTVVAYGNVLTAIAFLTGMAAEELSPHELEATDESFPVLCAVRAVK